jgi:hypothetical protein
VSFDPIEAFAIHIRRSPLGTLPSPLAPLAALGTLPRPPAPFANGLARERGSCPLAPLGRGSTARTTAGVLPTTTPPADGAARLK